MPLYLIRAVIASMTGVLTKKGDLKSEWAEWAKHGMLGLG